MTRLGAINSNLGIESVAVEGWSEVTGLTGLSSATLVDMTGLTFNLVIPTGIPSTAIIRAIMTFQASTTGGAPATGAWAISINGVDQQEVQRFMSGTSDRGLGVVQARVTGFGAGTYTVKGRHRRVSGVSTINEGVAQLSALAILL